MSKSLTPKQRLRAIEKATAEIEAGFNRLRPLCEADWRIDLVCQDLCEASRVLRSRYAALAEENDGE